MKIEIDFWKICSNCMHGETHIDIVSKAVIQDKNCLHMGNYLGARHPATCPLLEREEEDEDHNN